MTDSNMVEALARRNFEAEYDDLQWDELTDSVKQGWVKDAQAIIDFLSAAGFGLVADAGAKALEDAADAIDENPYGDLDPFYAGWLRDRARKIRESDHQ